MIDLLKFTESGGCSSKISPVELEKILSAIPLPSDPNLLVGVQSGDDAAVYRINEKESLILTTDFFPPVCSDPYEFGQIAAANSLSDVYAMGGRPLAALNIIMFPSKTIPLEAYGQILRGGFDKALEAACPIVGGHSIEDATPKYGLAVTGIIETEKVTANNGARAGDVLILTKKIGSGIVLSAKKSGLCSDESYREAIESMKQLNRNGATAMNALGIRGATDITGFSLAGHAYKFARESGCTFVIQSSSVPMFKSVSDYADDGCVPCGCFKNEDYVDGKVDFAKIDFNTKCVMLDPQTSGGLLFSCPKSRSEEAIIMLKELGYAHASIIGCVTAKSRYHVVFES